MFIFLQGTKLCRDMKKNLLVALALCLSYGFAYSRSFDQPINQTAKMSELRNGFVYHQEREKPEDHFLQTCQLITGLCRTKSYSLIQSPITPTIHSSRRRTIILITHEHRDHFDTKAIAAIETNRIQKL